MDDIRHKCEVRHLLKLGIKGKRFVDEYLAFVREKRGAEEMGRLKRDAKSQWVKGNRGDKGDWR